MSAPDLRSRLLRLHTALLSDVLDAMGHRSSAMGSGIHPLRPEMKLAGRAFTMKSVAADEIPDDPYVELLASFGAITPQTVVVIEAGDRVSAIWGELLSTAAMVKGSVGAVTDGLARDIEQILELDYPLFAAGYSPLDSAGRQHVVAHQVPVRCGDADVRPGDWIFGDVMGVIVIPAEIAEEAVTRAEEKDRGESTVRAELLAGEEVGEVFRRHGIL